MQKCGNQNSSILEKDRKYVWHPFTQMQTAKLIEIVRGKGVYLYDREKRRYLDAISSWWVNLHGHAHPYICKKIKTQITKLEHVLFAGFTHAPAVELAAKLLPLLPGTMKKIFYSDNGSTAVEVALKMALQFWKNHQNRKRDRIVCFKHSYHGDTFGAMSVAGKNGFNQPFWSHLFEVDVIEPPLAGQEQLSLEQLQKIIRADRTAAFIFEPLVLGSGGMRIYTPESIKPLLQLCHDNQILIISDEVMTGFGRTNSLFASSQLSIQPDLICLSKGLTGGFLPLGATVCSQKIFEAFLSNDLTQAFLHGHSYTANPLACTAALASLKLLKEKSCLLQREMIAFQHQQFCERFEGHPKLKRCESLGTILALEYGSETDSYFQPLRDKLYRYFLKKGIIVRPLGNVLYIMPPYCIQQGELHYIYKTIERFRF